MYTKILQFQTYTFTKMLSAAVFVLFAGLLLLADAQPASALVQEGFRFRNDNGSETAATWAENQDTNITWGLNTNLRFRALIDSPGSATTTTLGLQYKISTSSTWKPVGVDDNFPTIQSTSSASTSGATTHPITMPSGITVGDLILVFFSIDGGTMASTSGSDWNQFQVSTNGIIVTGTVFWMFATSTTPSLTVTSAASRGSSHIAYRISGAGTPVAEVTNGSGTNSNPAILRTSGARNYLLLASRHGDAQVVATVAPANYTNLYTRAGASATGASTNVAQRFLNTSNEDPGTFTSATEQWVAFTVAVPPEQTPTTDNVRFVSQKTLTGVASTTYGSLAWTTPANITSTNDAWATRVLSSTTASNYIIATSSTGMDIPPYATITGIEVFIERGQNGGSGTARDNVVQLLKTGGLVGSNLAVATAWKTTEQQARYGSSTALWGTTWTPADVNSRNFGLAFAVQGSAVGASATARIDHIIVNVYYTIPSSIEYGSSTNIVASGATTTGQLYPPAGDLPSDFNGGRIQDDENPSDGIAIATDDYSEVEWSIMATGTATTGEVYNLRVVHSTTTALTTYATDASLTIGTYAAPSWMTLSGRLYSDTGTTPITTGKLIRVAVETSTTTIYATTTDSSGNWAIRDIATSSGGTTWATTSVAGDDDSWEKVIYGNGMFVAVASAGDARVMTSLDGINWTARSAAGDNDGWRDVVYGNGLFVAVGNSGDKVMTSPDGINWTVRSAAGDNDAWFSLTYGNGRFVAVSQSNDRVMYSDDGISWTAVSAAGDDDLWLGVAYGNNRFVAISSSTVGTGYSSMMSFDGINWVAKSIAGDNDGWRTIAFGGGLFLAMGITGDRLATSPDGITWTVQTIVGDNDSWRSVVYANGTFVAVNSGGNELIATSPDAVTWTAQSGTDNDWFGVTYGKGRFVAVGQGGVGRSMSATAGFGNNTPVTVYVDGDAVDATAVMGGVLSTSSVTGIDLYSGYVRTMSSVGTTSTYRGNPMIVGGIKNASTLAAAVQTVVAGNYAYVTTQNDDSFRVIDISSSTNPTIVAGIKNSTTLNAAEGMVIRGDYAYVVAQSGDRITIIDISSSTNPTVVGSLADSTNINDAEYLDVVGNYAYIAAGLSNALTIVDISSTTNPVRVGGIASSTALTDIRDVSVVGNYAYVSVAGVDAFRVIDISSSTNPIIVGGIASSTALDRAKDLEVLGNYAYVTATDSLNIIDISSTTNPTIVGRIKDATNLAANSSNIEIVGNYVYYTANSNDSLRIIDISSSTNPTLVGGVASSTVLDGAQGLDIQGDYAYVTATDSLRIINLNELKSSIINFANADFYDDTDDADVLFRATTSTSTISGSLYLSENTTVYAPQHLNLAGNLVQRGVYEAERGEVLLVGNNQNINLLHTNASPFFDFTQATTAAATTTFATVASLDVEGTLTLTGGASNKLKLRSSTSGTRWYIDPHATATLLYLDVKDSKNNGATTTPLDCTTGCTDSGNNLYWDFPATVLILSGTLYGDQGLTALTGVHTLKLAVGTTTPSTQSTTTVSANGTYSFTIANTNLTATTTYLVFVDASTTVRAALAYQASSTRDVSGLNLYKDHLIVRSASSTIPVGISALSFYDSTSDADVQHTASSTTFTTLVGGAQTLYVWPNTTFAPPASTTYSGSFDNDGIYTAPPHAYFSGTNKRLDGTLTGSSTLGVITITGSYTASTSASTTELVINSGASFTASTSAFTTGDLTNNGTFTHNGGTLNLSGTGAFNSTSTFVSSFSVSAQDNLSEGIAFNPDGTRMFVIGLGNDKVYQYTLSTPWTVSTASFSASTSILAQDSNMNDLAFNPDGTKMYLVGSTGDKVYQYTLSTPWTVSTASFSASTSVSAQDTYPTGIAFSTDGTKLYVTGITSGRVNQYTLSTPWDVTSKSFLNFLAVSDSIPESVAFSSDGTKLYSLGSSNDRIARYTMTTPWAVTTASLVDFVSVAAKDTDPTGMAFSADGGRLYMVGTLNDNVHEYRVGAELSGTLTGASSLGSIMLRAGTTTISSNASTTDFILATSSYVSAPTILSVSGNGTFNGTFDAVAGTGVYLNGRNQTIQNNATTTFYDLYKAATSSATTSFGAGDVFMIAGTLTLQGTSSAVMNLRSTVDATQWIIHPRGTSSTMYDDVKDSRNSSSTVINCTTGCIDNGNNTNWTFPILTLSDHAAGQVSNVFSAQNQNDASLFAFRMAPTIAPSITISSLIFRVTGASSVVSTSSLSDFKLYRDMDANGVLGGGDIAVAGSGVFVYANGVGTITFSTSFVSTSTQSFILTGDTTDIDTKESLVLRLYAGDLVADAGVTGSVTPIQHQRGISGGGGRTASIGGAPPAGQGDRTGGDDDGGGEAGEVDEGADIIGNPNFFRPSAHSGSWTNGGNALLSDGVRAQAPSTVSHVFNTFGFTVPTGNTIQGIEVKLDSRYSSSAGTISVDLSWNAGSNYTSTKLTPTLTATDAVYTLGSESDTWGRSWSSSEFSDANLRVRVTAGISLLELDGIEVRIYHQAAGGGGGGGGGI